MPELLNQIETMSDEELEHLIAAARAQLEQRHELAPLSEEENQMLIERALKARQNGFVGRPAEEALEEMQTQLRARMGNSSPGIGRRS